MVSRIEEKAYTKGYRVTKEGLTLNPKGRVINPFPRNKKDNPHKVFTVTLDGKKEKCTVHRLQAYQKYGEKLYEEGIVTRHLDCDHNNNSWDNISIGTQQENMMDEPEEVRRERALLGSINKGKYDHEEVYPYYLKHGQNKTMDYFGMSSKGTLYHIIRKMKKKYGH